MPPLVKTYANFESNLKDVQKSNRNNADLFSTNKYQNKHTSYIYFLMINLMN